MRHSRQKVIRRTIKEYELLDQLVADLSDEEWNRLLVRPESKDPWTVKDALAHITYWKSEAARSARRQRRPAEEQGLNATQVNHLVYLRWHDRAPQDVLAWHRQVQEDVLAALREAPAAWFSGKERAPDWPADLDGHSGYHRAKDLEDALQRTGA